MQLARTAIQAMENIAKTWLFVIIMSFMGLDWAKLIKKFDYLPIPITIVHFSDISKLKMDLLTNEGGIYSLCRDDF